MYPEPPPTSRKRQPLTEHELMAVRLYASGLGLKEIAAHMDRKEQTVKNLFVRIRAKCGVSKNVLLIRFAAQRGLVKF